MTNTVCDYLTLEIIHKSINNVKTLTDPLTLTHSASDYVCIKYCYCYYSVSVITKLYKTSSKLTQCISNTVTL